MSISRTLTVAALAVSTVTAGAVAVASPTTPTRATTVASATHGTYQARALPSVISSQVYGRFGSAGTVRGYFVPIRSFVRTGHTVVQGDLATTLRRGNGALVGHSVRHNITMVINDPGARRPSAATSTDAAPRAAMRASCNVLHLVLGPLDLNLLGLKVHLNKVILDITAQSGSGALLGNLLCAVVHLLDGTSPTLTDLLNLSSLLNRILGLIT
jgi:hypothetical protein